MGRETCPAMLMITLIANAPTWHRPLRAWARGLNRWQRAMTLPDHGRRVLGVAPRWRVDARFPADGPTGSRPAPPAQPWPPVRQRWGHVRGRACAAHDPI